MKQIKFKFYLIILFSILLTNCGNNKFVTVSDGIIRVDNYDSNGVFLKSYFKKFNKELNQWYPANYLDYENLNASLTKYLANCEYTEMSLHLIKIDTENKNNNNNDQASFDANLNKNIINQEQFNNDENDSSNDDNQNLAISPPQENEQCLGGPENC